MSNNDRFGNSNPHADALRAATLAGSGTAPASSGVNVVALDTSIVVSGNMIGVNLAASSGLQISSGLQLNDTIAGNGLTIASKVLAVGVSGLGLGVGADAVTLTSSSNPGAAASILASDAGGALTLTGLTLTGNLNTSRVASHLIPVATDTYDLGSAALLWRQGYLSQLNAVIFAEQTIQLLGGWLMIPKDAGTLPAVASGTTQIDFGKAMTVGHFVLIRAHDTGGAIKAEYMQIGSLVSGTTYNVTRDVAGAHVTDPAWADGTPYALLGTTGDGRIELNSYDTPRISLINQGATYNAQTELIRIGDLNGNWGYGTQTFGVALGEYTASHTSLTLDSTNGLRLFNGTTQIGQWSAAGVITIGQVGASQNNVQISSGAIGIRNNTTERIGITAGGVLTIKDSGGNAVFTFDASAGAEFTKPLSLALTGGIYQGLGSFASPTTGLKIWSEDHGDGPIGKIGGFNSSNAQWYVDVDGRFYAGQGNVILDYTGEKIMVSTSDDPTRGLRFFYNDSGTDRIVGSLHSNYGVGESTGYVRLVSKRESGSPWTKAEITLDAYDETDTTNKWASLYLWSDPPTITAYGDMQILGAGSTSTGKLTINQGAADTEILALKSSDVAHGITGLAETDTFASMIKAGAAEGGVNLQGFSEATASLSLTGNGTADDTTKATTSLGYVNIAGRKKSGTGVAAAGANGNLLAIRTTGATRAIIDQEGDLHLDATSNINAWDDYDDVQLLTTYRAMTGAQLFSASLGDDLEVLAKTGVVTLNKDGHHFVSMKGLHALEIDAIRQLARRLEYCERRLLAA